MQKCRQCELCQFDRPSLPIEPIKHLEIPTRAFEIVSADRFEEVGKKFLVVTDWYPGFFFVRMAHETTSARILIKFMREAMCDTAAPDTLWSDRGPLYESAEFQDFLRRRGVKWRQSSPEYQQFEELAVKNVKSLVRKCWNGQEMAMDK